MFTGTNIGSQGWPNQTWRPIQRESFATTRCELQKLKFLSSWIELHKRIRRRTYHCPWICPARPRREARPFAMRPSPFSVCDPSRLGFLYPVALRFGWPPNNHSWKGKWQLTVPCAPFLWKICISRAPVLDLVRERKAATLHIYIGKRKVYSAFFPPPTAHGR